MCKGVRAVLSGLVGMLAVGNVGMAHAVELQPYPFEAAAREITQLFWLADTAMVCGWATAKDAQRFKHFSLRFLSAHMTRAYRAALASLVTQSYEDRIHQAAQDSADRSCESARWASGWAAYKAAADAHDAEF